jgi:hypothetical protein
MRASAYFIDIKTHFRKTAAMLGELYTCGIFNDVLVVHITLKRCTGLVNSKLDRICAEAILA